MSGETGRARWRLGCLARIVVAVLVVVGIVVAIGETLDQGQDAAQPRTAYDAGALEDYQPGTISYLEGAHIYVVRLPDGQVLALYDRSARAQELGNDCRVAYDEQAQLVGVGQVAGPCARCGGSTARWQAALATATWTASRQP
jgi:hypothetical protein